MSKCNGDCFNCVFDDCILEYGESAPKVEKKPDSTRQSYYERHKEERKAYQIAYGRRKYGYKPKVEKTKEEIKERQRKYQREYYYKNKKKCREYQRSYYEQNKDYFKKRNKENYKRRKEREQMTDYDKERNAIHIINPAIQYLDKDLLAHALTIIIDKYCSDRNMSCQQKCDFVFGIYKDFVELKNNV